MNYYTHKQHPNYYYKIRSVVRATFWSGLCGGLLFGAIKVSDSYGDKRPECDVTVNVDFTWDNNTTNPIDLATCRAPHQMVLESDGTWGWYEPELGK
jgi:hypothetical protein